MSQKAPSVAAKILPFRPCQHWVSTHGRQVDFIHVLPFSAVLAIIVTSLVLAPRSSADEPWVTADEYTSFHIVLPEDRAEWRFEAGDLFQTYWKRATGCAVPVVDAPVQGVSVFIGTGDTLPRRFDKLRPERLSCRGVCIRSFPTGLFHRHKALAISGRDPDAVRHAVYIFFDRYMGVRWFAPDLIYVPPHPPESLPSIRYRFSPPFKYADVGYYALWDDALEMRRAHGLADEFVHGPFGGHTFYALVPPDVYFDDHPEYYAMVDGERIAVKGNWRDPGIRNAQPANQGQLCCSNPEVAQVIADRIRAFITTPPGEGDALFEWSRKLASCDAEGKVWSVSQMDWTGACECPECAAIDEREGSPMGSILTLVNRVADLLAGDFPEIKIHTLAYTYSRKPPKSIRPRDNVIVQYCTFESDFARPLDDPGQVINRGVLRNLRGWADSAKHLYVWDYISSLRNGLQPHPNLHVLGPNVKLFADCGVEGMYEQAIHYPGAAFAESDYLRTYVLSKCLWDPDMDAMALRDEFIDHYYGEAAPSMKRYYDVMSTHVVDQGTYLGCFGSPYWLDYGLVTRAQSLLEQAFRQASSDSVRARLNRHALSVEYAALACPPLVRVLGDRFVLERPPGISFGALLNRFAEAGGRPSGANEAPAFEAVRHSLGNGTPARYREEELVGIENAGRLLWVVPRLQGAVVRWREKAFGVELLRGYEVLGGSPGVMRDFVQVNGENGLPAPEHYEVAMRSENRLTLRAKGPAGLIVEREMSVDAEGVDVVLTVHNPTSTSLTCTFGLFPEFTTLGEQSVEVWIEKCGAWARIGEIGNDSSLPWGGEDLPAEGVERWAYYIPSRDISVVNAFDGEATTLSFFYAYDNRHQEVDLNLVAENRDCKPGAARSLHASYRVMQGAPAAAAAQIGGEEK